MRRAIKTLVPLIVLLVLLFTGIGPAVARGSSHSYGSGHKSHSDVHVDGYFRKDGTYVRPHYRSAPDGNFWNNWSTEGNVNPYTGEPGHKKYPDSNSNYNPKSSNTYTPPSLTSPQLQESPQSIPTTTVPQSPQISPLPEPLPSSNLQQSKPSYSPQQARSHVNPKVVLNGKALTFDVPPTVENNRTLVPLRAIFEALGAKVQWDDASQTVTATKDGNEVKLAIGGQAYKNGQTVILDVQVQLIDRRTMVPVRFVSEAMGCYVEWDDSTETVSIQSFGQ